MELWLGIALVFVFVVYALWRNRRRTSDDLEAQTKGLPDDLRDKNTGLGSLPNNGRPWGGGN